MQNFKNILLVTISHETRPAGLTQALELASFHNAKLTVFDLVRELPRKLTQSGVYSENIFEEYRENRRLQIETLIKEVNFIHRPEIKILTGVSFLEIIGQVLGGMHDLLIIPEDVEAVWAASNHGANLHLLRNCSVPVWIVKPTDSENFQRIMVALDPKPSELNDRLNTKILNIAASLAARENAELHVIAVLKFKWETELREQVWVADQLLLDLEITHRNWLNQITESIDQHHGIKTQSHLIRTHGSVCDAISTQAKNHNVDVIVMGTLGRSGIPGFIIGNTAERILSRIKCSMLAVKPDGFSNTVNA